MVTPEVYAISMVLFSQHFKVVKPYSQAPSRSYHCTLDIGETHGAFPIIKWIGSLSVSSVYGAVQIEKTIYKVKYLFFYLSLFSI